MFGAAPSGEISILGAFEKEQKRVLRPDQTPWEAWAVEMLDSGLAGLLQKFRLFGSLIHSTWSNGDQWQAWYGWGWCPAQRTVELLLIAITLDSSWGWWLGASLFCLVTGTVCGNSFISCCRVCQKRLTFKAPGCPQSQVVTRGSGDASFLFHVLTGRKKDWRFQVLYGLISGKICPV